MPVTPTPSLTTYRVEPVDVFSWFVGLVEGEASFLRPSPSKPREPKIDIEMTDEVIIRKLAAMLGVTYRVRDRKRPNTNLAYHCRLSGKRAVQLMWKIRPYMSARRQAQILRAVQCFIDRGPEWHPAALGPHEFQPLCNDLACIEPRYGSSPYCATHHHAYAVAAPAVTPATEISHG